MERVISDEEKLRRAIEISQRRNSNYYINRTARVNVSSKKEYNVFKRIMLQMIICLVIYFLFYLISNNNYIFSNQIIKQTNEILNYDINFKKLYYNSQEYINSKLNKQNKEINNEKQEESTNVIENKAQEEAKIEQNIIDETKDKEKNTMEKDAESVKKMCKFKKPISGTITSEFGEREVTSKVMSADHKGIDIATKSGTNIQAAISGKVIKAEQNSEYGKFIKIGNGDVMTVYAHCKKLLVKEGEEVKIGDKIATVGTTGNSTGPHLHFEIRLSGRYINPRYVIEF